MRPPFKEFPLGIRLTLMFFLFFSNLTIVSYFALWALKPLFGIDNATEVVEGGVHSSSDLYAILFVQGICSLGGFMLSAMMFAVLESGEFVNHLRLKYAPSLRMIVLGAFAILTAQFFIQFLVKINSHIPLPPSLAFLKESQKQMEGIINSFLNVKGIGQFLVVSLVLAVIPAIAEEFFFRGLLLGDLLKSRVSPVTAIIASGLVFSLTHFEFENTLAIWALGCFLGYLYYASGTLWLPILVHFINNFVTILLKYLFNNGYIHTDISEMSFPLYITAASVLVFAFCIFVFNKWKNDPSFVEPDPITEDYTS